MVKSSAKSRPKKLTRKEKSARNKSAFRRVGEALKDPRGLKPPAERRSITNEDVEIIIAAISEGDTARGKCRELGVSFGSFFTRISSDDQLYGRYARARQSQAHALVEMSFEDIEAAQNIETESDGANVELGIYKFAFDVRRWLAGKYHVGAYGDKVTAILEGGDKPIRTIDETMSPEAAMAAYQEELRKLKT